MILETLTLNTIHTGHIYFKINTKSISCVQNSLSFMVGIENSPPGQDASVGGSHGASATSYPVSITLEPKFASFKNDYEMNKLKSEKNNLKMPNDIGGKAVFIDKASYEHIKILFEDADTLVEFLQGCDMDSDEL